MMRRNESWGHKVKCLEMREKRVQKEIVSEREQMKDAVE